ncbi:MAG: PTS transporter subunit EIIC [Eubacteriales bacterium]|nr:PTS transporter subunit EIIC [Eubacteriales bacterium]
MKALMYWLETKFVPKMNVIVKNPWVAAVSGSMQKILPFILTGSLIYIYNVIRSWLQVLPDLGLILQFSFQMISVILVFTVAYEAMGKLSHPQYNTTAGITAILTYLVTCITIDGGGSLICDFSRIGPSGMFVAIIVGLYVSFVFHLIAKLRLLEDSVTIPAFVAEWINGVIPIFLSLLGIIVLTYYLNLDIYNLILLLFSPITNFGYTLPGFILISLIPAFLYTFGVSTWFTSAVTTPILMGGTALNIAAAASGSPATVVCYESIYALSLIVLGGTGCTLPLNALMLFSKSNRLKTLGKVCLAPSLFNINEPIVFGSPVVFNPLLMIPMWVNTIVGSIIVWAAMTLELLAIPAGSLATGQVPAPFGYIMLTGDFRALIFYVLLFGIYMLTWLPFFRVYEKQVIQEEIQER